VQSAQETIARLTTQATGQNSTTVALQKQITELKTLVEEQQKLIEQLQKGAASPPAAQPGKPHVVWSSAPEKEGGRGTED
jgi:uncharacterized coiled-coil protein SlyX